MVKLVLAAVGRRKAHREIAQHPELGRDLLHRTSSKVLVGSERIQNLIELDLNHARKVKPQSVQFNNLRTAYMNLCAMPIAYAEKYWALVPE